MITVYVCTIPCQLNGNIGSRFVKWHMDNVLVGTQCLQRTTTGTRRRHIIIYLKLYMGDTGIVHGLHWNCTSVTLGLYMGDTGVVHRLQWGCTWVTLWLYMGDTGIVHGDTGVVHG